MTDRHTIQTLSVPLSFGGAGNFTIFPFAYAPNIPDTPDCFLATGAIHRIALNASTPPAVAAITIADYVDDDGAPVAGGSGAADPSPIHGQFPLSLIRGLAETDPNADGNGVNILAQGPDEGANGGVHIVSENSTFATGLSRPDRKIKGTIPDLTSATDMMREGRWECPNGMAINVVVGAAASFELLIDIELAKTGSSFYREWLRKDFRSRRFAIGAVTAGNPTVLEITSADQYVPVGREFKAKFSGTSIVSVPGGGGGGAEPLDGREFTLTAVPLASGDFILNVPIDTTGLTLSPAGNVDIVWPYGGIR